MRNMRGSSVPSSVMRGIRNGSVFVFSFPEMVVTEAVIPRFLRSAIVSSVKSFFWPFGYANVERTVPSCSLIRV